MSKYPILLELESCKITIIGAGSVALRKAQALLDTGARLVIIAENFHPSFQTLEKNPNIELIKSKYDKIYLTDAALVISATDNQKLNQRVYRDCRQSDIPCNTVDNPKLCDFYMPALIKKGNLTIAVSTQGDCPGYAGFLKRNMENFVTDRHGEFLEELRKYREKILEEIDNPAQRKAAIGELITEKSFEFYKENGSQTWRQRAEEIKNKYKDG
jgi:precorrin-2 dehydrogenase/sirohydrochlorin ferrochelatase